MKQITKNWIQIGNWQIDPKTISIKIINEIIAWEEVQAKRDILEKLENEAYKWLKSKKIGQLQYKMLINYIGLICPSEPESKLPSEGIVT